MNQLLKSFVTVVFILVLESRYSESSFSCYQCADPALQQYWTLTGLTLPPNIDKSKFFIECDDWTKLNQTQTIDTCQDFCFAMYITPLDKSGAATPASAPLYVRGCHYDFTTFSLGNALVGSDYTGKCQTGNIKRYTSSGISVNTVAGYTWCNMDRTGNAPPCNYANKFIVDSTYNCITGQSTYCYDCLEGSSAAPCKTPTTSSDTYCYASLMNVNDVKVVTRSTSAINPLYPGADAANQPTTNAGKCGSVNGSYPLQAATLSVNGQYCFCNSGDYCNSNGAANVVLSFVFLLFSASCYVFRQL